MIIYVGDSKHVAKRIARDHCSGNVEGSALRRHVARNLGFEIIREKRTSGTSKYRINSIDPKEDERIVSEYIRQGLWQVICLNDAVDVRDFQHYVIEKLNPLLNIEARKWNKHKSAEYSNLLEKLIASNASTWKEIRDQGDNYPGVYILHHDNMPE